jgi:hypothetical protein
MKIENLKHAFVNKIKIAFNDYWKSDICSSSSSVQELKLKKGYVMKDQDVVGVTAAESEPHGTATLLRCTLSSVVKSLSVKCMLHIYL